MTVAVHPVRFRLQRKGGWRLQDESRAINGLPGAVVSRGSRFGNPFSLPLLAKAGVDVSAGFAVQLSVECFEAWLEGAPHRLVPTIHRMAARRGIDFGDSTERRLRLLTSLPIIRDHNLGCWCKPGGPCHADVLLRLAN